MYTFEIMTPASGHRTITIDTEAEAKIVFDRLMTEEGHAAVNTKTLDQVHTFDPKVEEVSFVRQIKGGTTMEPEEEQPSTPTTPPDTGIETEKTEGEQEETTEENS